VDPSTYREVTRPHMKKHIPFPLNQFLPKKIHLETMQALELYGIKSKEQVGPAQLAPAVLALP